MKKYSDLKLIDELLCDMRYSSQSWNDVERHSSVTRAAMKRLRDAWAANEMPIITLSLAKYFEGEER